MLALMVALPVGAQEVATIVLRNGERPSGLLIDMGAAGFVLQINGQDRTIATGDVAAIEFVVGAPPAEAIAKINAGTPIVLLRSGQIVDGRLFDVGGTRPLRLSFNTVDGPRDFSSSDVAQIYMNPVPMGAATLPAPAPAPTAPAGSIAVSATTPWTDTGVRMSRVTRLTITGNGEIELGNGNRAGVGGNPGATVAGIPYPVPGVPAGALIGRVGNGRPFAITNGQPMSITGNGTLQLGVNDDHVGDNAGAFIVTVTR
jgi:hypothetical protein